MATPEHARASRSRDPSVPATGRPAQDAEGRVDAWPATGIAAGVLGAAVVALFFLILDVLQGRPLWTPSALGSALLLGERLLPDAAWRPALVLAYTATHGAFFVSFGSIAAFVVLSAEKLPRSRVALGIVIASALFACFEVAFVIFALVFAPGLVGELGAGQVAIANLLAAAAMSALLVAAATRREARG